MKKVFLFLSIILLFISCSTTKQLNVKQTSDIKKTVNTLLNNWHLAATEANYNNYFNAMDSVSVFIGTDASENWTKLQFQKFSKPYFDKGKAWNFKVLERNMAINTSGDFVWFNELLQTWMGTCRGSGVLEKVNNNWKIKQYVLSLTIPNNDIKAVINATKKSDSIFLANRLGL